MKQPRDPDRQWTLKGSDPKKYVRRVAEVQTNTKTLKATRLRDSLYGGTEGLAVLGDHGIEKTSPVRLKTGRLDSDATHNKRRIALHIEVER